MQFIKPQQYTYDMLCEIEAEQEEKKTGFAPLRELLCDAVIIVEYAAILIFALIVTYSRFKEGFFIIDTSSKFSAVNILFMCIYPVLIFWVLRICPWITNKFFIKAGFLSKEKHTYASDDWLTLKASLRTAERCIKIMTESETEPEITRAEDHIKVKYKENGYTKKEKLFFEKYTDKICKDNLLDFSVLDDAISQFLGEKGIDVKDEK